MDGMGPEVRICEEISRTVAEQVISRHKSLKADEDTRRRIEELVISELQRNRRGRAALDQVPPLGRRLPGAEGRHSDEFRSKAPSCLDEEDGKASPLRRFREVPPLRCHPGAARRRSDVLREKASMCLDQDDTEVGSLPRLEEGVSRVVATFHCHTGAAGRHSNSPMKKTPICLVEDDNDVGSLQGFQAPLNKGMRREVPSLRCHHGLEGRHRDAPSKKTPRCLDEDDSERQEEAIRREAPPLHCFPGAARQANDALRTQVPMRPDEGDSERLEKAFKREAPPLRCHNGEVGRHSDAVKNTTRSTEEDDSERLNEDVRREAPPLHCHPGAARRTNDAPRTQVPLRLDEDDADAGRLQRFRALLGATPLDLDALRRLSWSGVPMRVRAAVWRVLSLEDGALAGGVGLLRALQLRRRNYWALAATVTQPGAVTPGVDARRQIRMDVPRTTSLLELARHKDVRRALERVLLVWAARHPDVGYVQGMNDILAPVLGALLAEEAGATPPAELEADAYLVFSRLVGGVRDVFTAGRPGVHRAVRLLEALVRRVDGSLDRHLRRHAVDYLLFAFRWMNNLMTRELPMRCAVRLWDTYLAEAAAGAGRLAAFQVYVCVAFLQRWRERLLLEKDFNGVVLLLQDLPTHRWGVADVETLLAEAYRLQAAFADAPMHLWHRCE